MIIRKWTRSVLSHCSRVEYEGNGVNTRLARVFERVGMCMCTVDGDGDDDDDDDRGIGSLGQPTHR
jgi:hypothetical protein